MFWDYWELGRRRECEATILILTVESCYKTSHPAEKTQDGAHYAMIFVLGKKLIAGALMRYEERRPVRFLDL